MNKGEYRVFNVPVSFQKVQEYESEDTRFTKVKIWLMHTEKNHNGSYFSKEVIEEAIPTLSNTPILGFIEQNEDGEDDFSGHEYKVEKTEEGYSYVYKGSAYGIIPETNNAQFEMRVAEDGIEREYLTVEGLIWSNKFPKAQKILDESIEKDHSMELYEEYTGEMDNEGIFHFKEFKFYGACILGMGNQPAMEGSTIELMDYTKNKNDMSDSINNKLEEFKQLFARKGGSDMNEKLELLKEFSVSKEDVVAKGVDFEAIELDELRTKLEEFAKESEENTDTNKGEDTEDKDTEKFSTEDTSAEKDEADESTKEDGTGENFEDSADSGNSDSDKEEENSDEEDKMFTLNYKLSHDDVRTKLYQEIEKNLTDAYVWIMEVYDDTVVYEQESYTEEEGFKRKYFKQSYAKMDTDEIVLGESQEIFLKFLTEEELNKLEKDKEELYELKEFKADFDKKVKEKEQASLFNKYSMLNGIEDFEALKEKADEFENIEELESKIALVYVRNNDSLNFSKEDEDESNELEFSSSDEKSESKSKYGGLLEKYAK